jgi:hypothetical protein
VTNLKNNLPNFTASSAKKFVAQKSIADLMAQYNTASFT